MPGGGVEGHFEGGDVGGDHVGLDHVQDVAVGKVVDALALGFEDQVAADFFLVRGRVDAAFVELLVQLVEVDPELDRLEDRDPERAAELLGGVDHPRRLAAVLVRDRGQPGRVVDGEDDAEAEALQQQARDQGDRRLAGDRDREHDARGGEDEEAADQRPAPAEAVEGPARQRAGEDHRDRRRDQRDPRRRRRDADHQQEEERGEEAEPELDHPGQHLAQVRGEEVLVAEELEVDHRVVGAPLDRQEDRDQEQADGDRDERPGLSPARLRALR